MNGLRAFPYLLIRLCPNRLCSKKESLMSQLQHNQENNIPVQNKMRKRKKRGTRGGGRVIKYKAAIESEKLKVTLQETLNKEVASSPHIDISATNDIMEESIELSPGNASINSEFSVGNQNNSEVKLSDQSFMNKPKGTEYVQTAGCSSSSNGNDIRTPEKENSDLETSSVLLPMLPLKLGANQKSLNESKQERSDTDFLNEQFVRNKKIAESSEGSSVFETIASAVFQLVSKESVQKDTFLENAEKKKSSLEMKRKLCQEKIAAMNKQLDELNAKKMQDLEETNKYLLNLQRLNDIKENVTQQKIRELTQENQQLLNQYQCSLKMIEENYTKESEKKEKIIQNLQQEVESLNRTLDEKCNQFRADLKCPDTEIQKKINELEKCKLQLKNREDELKREKKKHDYLKALFRQHLANQPLTPDPELSSEVSINNEPIDLADTQPEIQTETISLEEVSPDAKNSTENLNNNEGQTSLIKREIDLNTAKTPPLPLLSSSPSTLSSSSSGSPNPEGSLNTLSSSAYDSPGRLTINFD